MLQGHPFLLMLKRKLYSKQFQKKHRIGENSFVRERKLTFPVIFSMILKSIAKSLSIECELLNLDVAQMAPSKQAFSKARYKIAHTGFQELLDLSIETHYAVPDVGTWRGYRIIAADGSSIRLPDSEEVVSEWKRFNCNTTQGRPPILGRVSLFVDLCTSVILSGRLASWEIGEERLAEEQMPEVVHRLGGLGQKNLLFVYDRGYTSLKFMKDHHGLGADFIMRLQKGTYKEIWRRIDLGERDFDFVFKNKPSKLEQKVRVLGIQLSEGEIEVLITSMDDREKFTLEDISKIYFLRWHIEECYKRLKVCTELENFSGVKPEAIKQEFWAHLVMCNLLALHMFDKQGAWDPDEIPDYRLNFSVLFGVMKEQLFKAITGKCSAKKFQKLFDRVAIRAKVKVRPGRSYSRRMAGRPLRHHVYRGERGDA